MFTRYNSATSFLATHEVEQISNPLLQDKVSKIIEAVRSGGDEKIREFTKQYDGVKLVGFRVPENEIEQAVRGLSVRTREVFETAIRNVREFHEREIPQSWSVSGPTGGSAGIRYSSIANVGIYVPGGRAAYPSTVIMTTVPAQIAMVDRIALVSPPNSQGKISSLVLAISGLLGLTELYSVGGAQAIAALAFGTKTITGVDKIVGPGNAYVNEAKRQVFGRVGIDSLAGPTELVILADESTNTELIVRDLLAQAEHDPEARVICVTVAENVAEQVERLTQKLLPDCERADILAESIANHGALVVVKNSTEAATVVNRIAPDHAQPVPADHGRSAQYLHFRPLK